MSGQRFDPPLTGGCQCGAVRFRVNVTAARPSICHCRMCQKAFGSYFGPFVAVAKGDFALTRGEPAYYRSSNQAERGFCSRCGTPLLYRSEDGGPEVALGALDEPERLPPEVQVGVAARLSFLPGLFDLPERPDGSTPEASAFNASVVSRQHPDHDTDRWPTEGAR